MWRKEKQGLENEIKELTTTSHAKNMERASKEAELYNLKNAVAKIPQEVRNAYIKSKPQQKIHRQEER